MISISTSIDKTQSMSWISNLRRELVMFSYLRVIAALACSVSCVVVAPVVHAEAAPAKVTIEHKFLVPADVAWKELGRFCSIAEWQSLVASCVTEERKDGIYRTIVMNDNSVFVEKLEEYSSNERSFAYTIKSGPLPIANYRSELRFLPVAPNETQLVWRAWYTVPSGANEQRIATDLKELFVNGIKGMDAVLATAR